MIDTIINDVFPTYRAALAMSGLESNPITDSVLGEIHTGARQVSAELEAMGDDELVRTYKERLEIKRQREAEQKEKQRAENLARQEAETERKRAETLAIFDHWSKMAVWTDEEAAALMHGRHPNKMRGDPIDSSGRYLPFWHILDRTRELFARARESGAIPVERRPRDFIKWAKAAELSVPFALEEMVQKRAVLGVAIHDDAAEKNGLIEELRGRIAQLEQTTIAGNLNSNGRGAKAAAKKERDTLLKLFFAAATSGLGCRPHTDLSGSVKNICEAVSEVGLKIDAGAVRKYVREAAELIDPADLKPLGAKRR